MSIFDLNDLIRVLIAGGQLLIVGSLAYVYLCLKRYCRTHDSGPLVRLYLKIIGAAAHYVVWSVIVAVIGLFVARSTYLTPVSLWRLATVIHVLVIIAIAAITFMRYEESSEQ